MERLIAALTAHPEAINPAQVAAACDMDRAKVTELLDALVELGTCQHVYRLVPGENLDTALEVINAAASKPAA